MPRKKPTKLAGGPVSRFIQHHYRHFNAASLVDAAKGYVAHLDKGGKMMITLGGAMSTAELGLSLAEMIRQDKVQLITCRTRCSSSPAPARTSRRTFSTSSRMIITNACGLS